MKKVGIITITNSGLNCGNRLQNYALQTVLQGYSVRAETIYSSNCFGSSLLLSRLRRLLKTLFRSSGRRRLFGAFEKKHIVRAARVRYGTLNQHRFAGEYDAFIAGSDQVWNPTFPFNSAFEFLTFAPPEKRYAYAASFGVSAIPPQNQKDYAEWLSQMREISVREEQGREIVSQLTGRSVPVHLDPTMLLPAEAYHEIEEKPPQPIPQKYLLVYFLGEITPEYRAFTQQLAGELGLPVLELSELPGTPLYHIGPQHFLHLFHHASYVCTDSFHGTIFSILFRRRFTVFYRKNNDLPMNSRIETLLQKTGLETRLFGQLPPQASLLPIDYAPVEQRYAAEQQKAHTYLRNICAQPPE